MPYKGQTSAPIPSTGKSSREKPVLEKTKSVSYSATQSDQIFAVSASSSSSTTESMPSRVEIMNDGKVPLMLMAGYETYTDDRTDGVTEYLHTMLMPGETYYPPVRGLIQTDADTVIVDGTVVSNSAPNSNEYVDSGADIDSATAAGVVGSDTNSLVYLEPYTSAANCTANLFRVGDLIRVNNEVMKVTSIGTKAALNSNTLVVERGMYGTSAVDTHADDAAVRLPFFNAYTNDLTKRTTTVDGKFKAFNFFGLGRSETQVQGITPGSVAIKFYEAGYQEFGLSGITSSTNSGLSASTTYYLSISIDGATTDKITFTTDSSNLNFGGKNGVIAKLQSAIDALYYNPSKNGFQKGATVSIVDGDIRVTSNQHSSTSAISITTNTDGTAGTDELFDTSNIIGRIPATIKAAVAARLPDDVTYDEVTYAEIPNEGSFVYDDGNGNLFGAAEGTINYETGAIDFKNAPSEAEFVVSCMHSGAFSGKLNEAETDRINSLIAVYANTTSQKMNGSVKVRTY
ncbi:MAG: hypothetical protein GOVbin212_10 [Prokaryotic dsDNA virus sp.]|nr:MAG: hypothetical protein GOVbin212_10 [Prokaryotic dsDNA virus sp.]|tara:strand:+ start:3734 stop:5278 length:1545 start_codon:yes stop_codon:yes gene_type:complete